MVLSLEGYLTGIVSLIIFGTAIGLGIFLFFQYRKYKIKILLNFGLMVVSACAIISFSFGVDFDVYLTWGVTQFSNVLV